ncbi:vegetative incompatibility protein het-e-1 [Colletotrichum plurivorum]|uniref:Vegetative incompatibility protein het-e-1 n=1 Tax=Colletotrichum plurivorum TaxID=2175906 RepID=A0A8H6JWS9_9PEZI|nr:vegetative incompatibility protein het-e-1 [Colletotrichum plurivorum]
MASHVANHGPGSQFFHGGTGNQNIVQHILSGETGKPNTSAINRKLLSALRRTDPRDDKLRIERTKGGLLRDSYRWILDDDDFVRWRYDPERRLLWIRGDPGKGKTMLMCGIIDELNRYEEYKPLYFFCQATNSDLNNATSVLRGLLYSFLAQHPESCDLVPSFRQRFKHSQGNLFADTNVWDALNSTFKNELLHHEAFKDVVIIIDAMDECTHDLKELLEFVIGVSSHLNPIKVIVSSRIWLQVEERMRDVPHVTSISLEDNRPAVSKAVTNYIRAKTEQLASQRNYTIQQKEEMRSYLTTNAHHTFLWVALVIEQLEHRRDGDHATTMRPQDLPPGLGPFFQRMFDQILEDEEDYPKDVELCIQVLSVTSTVYRPVTLVELESLMQLPHESLEETIMLCRSILTVDRGTVYFVHQSAKDFLLQHQQHRIMLNGLAQVHHSIFRSALYTMSSILRRDMYDLKFPGAPVPETPPNQNLAPATYSCLHWVDHLLDGGPTAQQLQKCVPRFLKLHYLHCI